jgi:hypothetical protein
MPKCRFVLCTLLVLTLFPRDARGQGDVEDPPATVLDTSATAPLPADLAAPSAASLADLRKKVGDRVIRLHIGRDEYVAARARLGPDGVYFAGGPLEGRAVWRNDMKVHPPPLTSPVAWGRLEGIEVRHTQCAVGVLLGVLACEAAVGYAMKDDGGGGMGAFPVAAGIGAAVGFLAGGTILGTWTYVWRTPFHPAAPPR